MLNEKEREFIIGLNELTRKTGIAVGGCGCCSSPFLIELATDELGDGAGYGSDYASEVQWISPVNKYDWEEYKDTIYK
jgi:hypothetical protein